MTSPSITQREKRIGGLTIYRIYRTQPDMAVYAQAIGFNPGWDRLPWNWELTH